MHRLHNKPVSLLAQASMFVLAYYEIWPFPVNYESVMLYDTGPRCLKIKVNVDIQTIVFFLIVLFHCHFGGVVFDSLPI